MLENKGFNPFWVAYKNLEDEFIGLSKSICINDTQLNVYSMKIADLLVICAVQIEAISKALYKKYGGPTKTNAKGDEVNLLFDCDCIKFLDAKLKICSKVVNVSSAYFAFDKEENCILTPLLDCDKKGKGDWKVAYQDVKHDRMQNLVEGNLKSFIRALAALYILNLYYEPITVQLGATFQPELNFDGRMGSSIFSVSFVDATKNVSFGEDETDDAIDQSVKDGLTSSIYVLRYNSSSWNAIHDSILNANKTIVDELLKSETFRKDDAEGKIKGKHIISLVNEYLGDDYLRTHNSYRDFSLALNKAQSEAIIYEGQPIYG